MELAIREALGLPTRAAPTPASSQCDNKAGKRTADRSQRGRMQSPEAPQPKVVPPAAITKTAGTPAALRLRKKKTGALAQPVVSKRAKPPKKTKPVIIVVRKPVAPSVDRQKEAAANAASRLAINARMRRAALETQAKPVSPFVELQRRWQQAFAYLQRFEDRNPDAPDVMAAKERLVRVEAEWEHRQALAPDQPDYFPWPSTEAPTGDGSVVTGEWQEIGMLAYLGYHVGLSSTLTAAQRAQLLGRIFTMRLPPLNGIHYMRKWGSPETASRLKKVADGLAACARNAKRRTNPSLAEAIRQWEADLAQLRRTYYVGRFDFPWPMP